MDDRYDRQTEAVLQALRQVVPEPGMEDRLMFALRCAEDSTRAIGARHAQGIFSKHSMPWLTAAALLLVACGTLLYRSGVSKRDWNPRKKEVASGMMHCAPSSICPQAGRPANPSAALRDDNAEGNADAFVSQREDKGRRYGEAWQARSDAQGLAGGPDGFRPGSLKLGESHVSEARQGAPEEEDRGRSFPPPPLPLTEQERLLLRLARQEPLPQLAQLTKPALDTMFQREKDRVTEFFAAPPPMPDEHDSPTDMSETGQQ